MVAVQVRDVPDEVRALLAEEARRQGLSLQAYLLEVLTRESRKAHNRSVLSALTPIRGSGAGLGIDVTDLIAQQRDVRVGAILDSLPSPASRKGASGASDEVDPGRATASRNAPSKERRG